MQAVVKNMGALAVLFLAICSSGQPSTDFTGHWQQETNSATQRQLEIEQNGNSLLVRTIITNSQGARRLEVKYEIGGPPTAYTGLDGDQFRSSVHWDGGALVFEIIEHESGNEVHQKAVWTLLPDRSKLQVERDVTKSGNTTHSSTTYGRQS
jgi:hypothetical protein